MEARTLAFYAYHNCEFRRALALVDSATPAGASLRVRILCELDEKAAALAAAREAVGTWPEEGLLHYLLGQAAYLAGCSRAEIEAAFLGAAERRYAGAGMGLGFIEFTNKRYANAVSLLRAASVSDHELDHVRRLMLFQVLTVDQKLPEAESELRAADQLLVRDPSLLRRLWSELCWVRLLRAKGNFDGALALLDRVESGLDSELTPRLWRNASEARHMIEVRRDDQNIIIPPARAGAAAAADPRVKAIETITRKPMLHSLFTYLGARGPEGATKEEIVEHVWEERYNPLIHDDRIYKAVGRIRRLLGDDLAAPTVLTQMGRNYILNIQSHDRAGTPLARRTAGDPS